MVEFRIASAKYSNIGTPILCLLRYWNETKQVWNRIKICQLFLYSASVDSVCVKFSGNILDLILIG